MTAEHLFELAYPEIRAAIRPGEFIVAGKNFGCGSSREQAAAALKFAGVGAVIAGSFARIFYRNSINLGLPAMIAPEVALCVHGGRRVGIGPGRGRDPKRDTQDRAIASAKLDPRAVELIKAGGLIAYLKRKYAA